jgi:predicted transcriptional regulator
MAQVRKRQVEQRLEEVRAMMHTMIDNPSLLDAFPEEVFVPLNVELSSLFAPARLELLRNISKHRLTVGEMAHAVHRKIPAVSRDLKLLEKYGLVRFHNEGRRKYPELVRHFVVLPLDGPTGHGKVSQHAMVA